MSPTEDHYRKLERMYMAAPTNRYYDPLLTVSAGRAEVEIAVREDFWHAADAVHGSVYFKMLDDAAFFAVNSLIEDYLALTLSFNIYLLRPISEGVLKASGRVIHTSRRLYVADSHLVDGAGAPLARGSGSFVRSRTALTPEIGYE